jgi:hypothetical protein
MSKRARCLFPFDPGHAISGSGELRPELVELEPLRHPAVAGQRSTRRPKSRGARKCAGSAAGLRAIVAGLPPPCSLGPCAEHRCRRGERTVFSHLENRPEDSPSGVGKKRRTRSGLAHGNDFQQWLCSSVGEAVRASSRRARDDASRGVRRCRLEELTVEERQGPAGGRGEQPAGPMKRPRTSFTRRGRGIVLTRVSAEG